MTWTQYQNQESKKTPHGIDVRALYEKPDAQVMHITLKSGEKLLRHVTPVDVFFYVLEGTGVVEIGEEKQSVSKDTLIESPKNIVHAWYNESDAPLRFLVVKTPRPEQKSKVL